MISARRSKTLLCAISMLWVCSLAAQSGIDYLYDELNRLVAVVDPSGDTAVYAYDAVGNILSISRHASSQVSIVAFFPDAGPIGTVVTILGTGFSATPSQNTVTFHGTTATVSSATTTRLVVAVPSGATTGTIGVTSPNGSASSATSFTVTSSGAPSITSFTPTIGIWGTSVSVSGTNFDTTIPNDRLSFNITRAVLSSATSTSMSTGTPVNATTGHLTLSTPLGTAISSGYFFVPPGSHAVSDVQYTGDMAPGQSESATISTAGKIGLVAFDGVAGQRISLRLTASGSLTMDRTTILSPSGLALGILPLSFVYSGFVEPVTLPITGTNSIMLEGLNGATGTMTYDLYTVSDQTGTVVSGTPFTSTLSTPGQAGRYTFSATAGQLLAVQLSSNTMSSVAVTVTKPDGTVQTTTTSSSSSFALSSQWLSATGTYVLVIDPTSTNTGSLTVAASLSGVSSTPPSRTSGSIIDPSSSLAAHLTGLFVMNEGSGTTTANLANMQTASFSGGSTPTWNTSDPSVVFNGGSSLNSYLNAGTDSIFDQLPNNQLTVVAKVYVNTLAAAGIAEKNDGNTINSGFVFGWDSSGAVKFTIEKSTTNMRVATGTGLITTGHWIQVAVTWDGTVGSAASAHLFINGTEQGKATSDNGSGSIGYANATSAPFRIGNAAFEVAGSLNGKMAYLAVYKNRLLTSSELGQLDSALPVTASDLHSSITPNGSSVTETTTTAGQRSQLTFTATQAQLATIQLTGNSLGSTTVSLLKPDRTTLASVTSSATSFSVPIQYLPASGYHTIYVQPGASATGSITVALTLADTPARPGSSTLDTSQALATNMVGLFVMNEGSGTTDANLVNSATAAFAGGSTPTWNTSDPSVVFNGGSSLNSYLNAGTDSIFDQLPNNQLTVVAKVYVNTLAAAGIAEKNDGNTINSGFVFGWDSSGAVKFTIEKSTTNMRVATGTGLITTGRWIQVAVTWDGTVGTAAAAHVFVDGVEQSKASSNNGSGTIGYSNATNKNFRIGNAGFDVAGSLNGKMAYLAVYKGRILTASELTQLDTQLPIH